MALLLHVEKIFSAIANFDLSERASAGPKSRRVDGVSESDGK